MRTTVKVHDHHEEQIDAEKDRLDEDEPGTSKAVRSLLDRAAEADELREQLDDARNRVDELRSQLAAANQRIDASNELVAYVEAERDLQTRREWREEQRAHSGLGKRLKWAITGMPEPPDDVDVEA